jgi:hypothetical protein
MHLDISTAPSRHPIRLTSRWTIAVLELVPGIVAVGVFLDVELFYAIGG